MHVLPAGEPNGVRAGQLAPTGGQRGKGGRYESRSRRARPRLERRGERNRLPPIVLCNLQVWAGEDRDVSRALQRGDAGDGTARDNSRRTRRRRRADGRWMGGRATPMRFDPTQRVAASDDRTRRPSRGGPRARKTRFGARREGLRSRRTPAVGPSRRSSSRGRARRRTSARCRTDGRGPISQPGSRSAVLTAHLPRAFVRARRWWSGAAAVCVTAFAAATRRLRVVRCERLDERGPTGFLRGVGAVRAIAPPTQPPFARFHPSPRARRLSTPSRPRRGRHRTGGASRRGRCEVLELRAEEVRRRPRPASRADHPTARGPARVRGAERVVHVDSASRGAAAKAGSLFLFSRGSAGSRAPRRMASARFRGTAESVSVTDATRGRTRPAGRAARRALREPAPAVRGIDLPFGRPEITPATTRACGPRRASQRRRASRGCLSSPSRASVRRHVQGSARTNRVPTTPSWISRGEVRSATAC
jgi:hypothetical protein